MTYRRPSRPPHSPLDTVCARLAARRQRQIATERREVRERSPVPIAAGWLSVQQRADCPSHMRGREESRGGKTEKERVSNGDGERE